MNMIIVNNYSLGSNNTPLSPEYGFLWSYCPSINGIWDNIWKSRTGNFIFI